MSHKLGRIFCSKNFTLCLKSLRHTGNFDLEKRTHSDISPFKCDVCKLSFKHKLSLIQHKGSKKHLAKMKCLTDRDQEKDKISHTKDKISKPLKISNRKTKNTNNNRTDFVLLPCQCCFLSLKSKVLYDKYRF